jgi:hypothetical protein
VKNKGKGSCETAAEHYLIVVMPLLICFTKHHEQPHILFFIYFSHDMRIYKNRMPTGLELSIFKKPGGILHSARCSLHTLEKSEQVFMNTTISYLFLFSILHFLSLSDAMSSENAIQGQKGGNKEELISSPPPKKAMTISLLHQHQLVSPAASRHQ